MTRKSADVKVNGIGLPISSSTTVIQRKYPTVKPWVTSLGNIIFSCGRVLLLPFWILLACFDYAVILFFRNLARTVTNIPMKTSAEEEEEPVANEHKSGIFHQIGLALKEPVKIMRLPKEELQEMETVRGSVRPAMTGARAMVEVASAREGGMLLLFRTTLLVVE